MQVALRASVSCTESGKILHTKASFFGARCYEMGSPKKPPTRGITKRIRAIVISKTVKVAVAP